MSLFQKMELLDPSSFLFYTETSICRPRNPLSFPSPFLVAAELENELALGFTLDLLTPAPSPFDRICAPPSPFDVFKSAIELIQVEKTPSSSSCGRIRERSETDAYLRSLCSRVSALELGLDRALKARPIDGVDRKYKLTAEVKGPEKSGVEKKYKWTAEIKGGKSKHGKLAGVEKNYTWTKEIKGKGKDGPITQTYTFKSSAAPSGGASGAGKADKKKTESTKLVEIEDADPAAVALKQVFAKRKALAIKNSKGKKKELSAQDAALIIQVNFRSHLVRRSQALRELRDLAVAKAKLKEIRAFFSNFSYRRRIASDPEERQRFSEKIIVLLLTVDAIEGVDPMVRAVRRSMLEELEAMLDVVDPQPPGKFGLLKRRKFDLPGVGSMQKDIALGVAEVVHMLDQEDNGSSVFTEV